MKKLLKFVAILIILVLLALVGLAIFVNTYFTDERLRAMLVPPLEQALGRTVEIGHINVSLFTGINVYDVAVKEKNGVDNFFSSNRFVLAYDLVPLLNKQVVIHEVRLVAPEIKVYRDQDGIFNFSSLAFLAKKTPTETTSPARPSTPLPFSITVDKMVVENGKVAFSDATGIIPPTTLSADISVSLDLGQGLQDISFQGESTFNIDTNYQGIKPLCAGKINFSKTRLAYSLDLALHKDQINLSGAVENYLQGGDFPPLALSISGRNLDIKRVQASLAALTAKQQQDTAPAAAPSKGQPSPLAKLQVQGQVDLANVKYDKIIMQEIKFGYSLEKGILSCQDLRLTTMGGEVRGKVKTALESPQSYNGKIGIHNLQLAELQQALRSDESGGSIKGQLSSAFDFAGTGFALERIKSNLTATGDLEINGVKLQATPLGQSLAALLNLPEIKDLTLSAVTGSFTIHNGRLQLDTSLEGPLVSGRTVGDIGLDGSLNLPLTLTLSPALSKRLTERLAVAKYLEKKGDQTVVRLDVKGSVSQPNLSLNKKYIRQQTTNSLVDKAMGNDASPEEKAAGEAVKGVLNNLFGK